MKKIKAKFTSHCAETGKRIAKGEDMYYDYSAKKCYCMSSERAQFEESLAGSVWANNDGAMVQAQEETYFDNFCTNNDI